MGWVYLGFAGLFEVAFAVMLKLSENFTKPLPSVLFVVFAFCSFFLMTRAMLTIPIGTAYAVWAGIGAAGTLTVGILAFGDPVTFWRLVFAVTLIASIVGLKVVS